MNSHKNMNRPRILVSLLALFKVHYRSKSGNCKWKCISFKGCEYHLAIPITKWVFKLEPFTNWIYVARNVF